jgi:hypothetical protein
VIHVVDALSAKEGVLLPGPPELGPPVSWFHGVWVSAPDDEPVDWFDELDALRWSIRCVRKFRDGSMRACSYASSNWRDEIFPLVVDCRALPAGVHSCRNVCRGRMAKILERRKNLYFTGRSSLPERRVGATGTKAASATSSISQSHRAESEFRDLNLWVCDHAAS